jgi:hypothetical protein
MPELIGRFFREKNFDGAAAEFLRAAWQQEAPSRDAVRSQLGDRFPRYLVERMFARFLQLWMVHRARTSVLSEEDYHRIGWHLGIDVKGLMSGGSSAERLKLEVHAVRPTVRLRSDGRSKVELMIVLAQRRRTMLLADPDDASSRVLGPDGNPLSFWFRGGTTVIVDPEEGRITYSVSKNILSEGRKGRQMTYLRNELARQGSAALARLGLTESLLTTQRRLEPFALAHSPTDHPGAY